MIYALLRLLIVSLVVIFTTSQQFSTQSMGIGAIVGGFGLIIVEILRKISQEN
jgi:hypothetical protein